MKKFFCALILFLTFTSSSHSELHTSTESEREEHLNIALSNIEYPASDMDVLNFKNSIDNVRNNFLRLYSERWQKLSMSDKLTKAVDESINAKTKKMLWGTKSLQLGLNKGNVINKIQENIALKFSGEYDSFLREIEYEFVNVILNNEFASFHKRISSLVIASDKNPISRAYLRKNLEREIDSSSLKMNLKAESSDYDSVFRKEFASYLGKYLEKAEAFKKLSSSAAGKLISENIPVIGELILAWSIYDLASMAWKAESDLRKILHERNQAMYSKELPLIYWDVTEPYIIKSFIESYKEIQNTRRQSLEFANDPELLDRYAEMNEAERIKFAEEILK